jgi:hypothetical protein
LDQGEPATNGEALAAKEKGRISGGCAGKDEALTQGDLALRLKGRRCLTAEREVSISRSSPRRDAAGEGLNGKESANDYESR